MRTSSAFAALTLSLSLTLTACGSDASETDDTSGSETTPSKTEHNDADVAFASGMIQHHAQALAMVDLTMERDLDPKVQALAEEVRAAQAPEIETMADWLTSWGEEIPETVRDHANSHHEGHDMDDTGGDMPGMMTPEDMAALEEADDAEFEDMWLEMMIEHHEGAVEMAQTEVADGRFKPAVGLAEEIAESQTAEIEKMQGLLS